MGRSGQASLLEYLGDNLAGERVLCVVSLRSEPSAALELARRQRGRPGIVHVELRPLDRDDAAAMVSACAVDASLSTWRGCSRPRRACRS